MLRYLLQKIVFNDPTTNCRIQGKKSDWLGLPASKSLFCTEEGRGFPIGNLTLQLFGNVYLNDLDHFIKNELGARYYGRYVDDLVLVHTDRQYLLECRQHIGDFLRGKLFLCLHPRKFYLQHYSKGVSFLGVFIKPHQVYIGKRSKVNFYCIAKQWNTDWQKADGRVTREELFAFRSKINSCLGILSHYKTYNLREKVIQQTLNNSFHQHFVVPASLHKVILKQPSRVAPLPMVS